MISTGNGKRSALLDLRSRTDSDTLFELVKKCDVFSQSYRPNSLSNRGFSPWALPRVNKSIIYVTLSAYSHLGPWNQWRGYDILVQSASGIAHESGAVQGDDSPMFLPCQALDYATGYLAAFGAMVALKKRATQGGQLAGSRLSGPDSTLAGVFGRSDKSLSAGVTEKRVSKNYFQKTTSPYGDITFLRPAGSINGIVRTWDLPPVPLGMHLPERAE